MIQENILTEIEQELKRDNKNLEIPETFIEQLQILFSDKSIYSSCYKVLTSDFIKNANFEQIKEVAENFDVVSTRLNKITEELDIYLFLREGYRLDYDGLMAEFKKRKLDKLFPDINIKALTDLYANPLKKIKPYYKTDEEVYVNPVVFRKFVLAILQMVFDEMDLLVVYTGSEGVGKSSLAGQHMLLIHQLLAKANIKDYPYSIKQMMFNNLAGLRVAEDDHFSEKFRQFNLDEGNELHRQNWKEEEVQTFFQRLRRERYNQRIKSICIPVLGELLTNVVMSRVNFIFEVYSENINKLGILQKGKCNLYIIPRGRSIYSYLHKKELTQEHIKQVLYDTLDKKNYLKGLPKELVVQNFTFNGTQGFKKEEYIKELKESNRSFNVKEGVKLGNGTLYILYRLIKSGKLRPKNIRLTSKEPEYASFHKLIQTIRKYIIDNPRIFKNEEEKFSMKH